MTLQTEIGRGVAELSPLSNNIRLGIEYESVWRNSLSDISDGIEKAINHLLDFHILFKNTQTAEYYLNHATRCYKYASTDNIINISTESRALLAQRARECDKQLVKPWEELVDILLTSDFHRTQALKGTLATIGSGVNFKNEFEEFCNYLQNPDMTYVMKKNYLVLLLKPSFTANPQDTTPYITSSFGYTVLEAVLRAEYARPTPQYHNQLIHLFDPPQASA